MGYIDSLQVAGQEVSQANNRYDWLRITMVSHNGDVKTFGNGNGNQTELLKLHFRVGDVNDNFQPQSFRVATKYNGNFGYYTYLTNGNYLTSYKVYIDGNWGDATVADRTYNGGARGDITLHPKLVDIEGYFRYVQVHSRGKGAAFNTAQENYGASLNANTATAIADANSQRQSAINQFNSTLSDQRQRFNVENQRIIDQSNTVWRRQLNTSNTQAVNAANETNAQNLLNLSNFALSSLWQQWRDEASWVNQSSENEANRNHNLAVAALERTTALDLQNSAQTSALYAMLGSFGMNIFSKYVKP